MTRLEVEVGDVVLRGLPATYGDSFGPSLERRLGDLARGDAGDETERLGPEAALIDRVARQLWDEVRQSTGDIWGESR
jgi:hypothetical protein